MFQADLAQPDLFQSAAATPKRPADRLPPGVPFGSRRPYHLRLDGVLPAGTTYSVPLRWPAGESRAYVVWTADVPVEVYLEYRAPVLWRVWQKSDGVGGGFLLDRNQNPRLGRDVRLRLVCPAGGATVTAEITGRGA